jgi:hypothetical protein
LFFREYIGDSGVARYVPDIDDAGLLGIADGDLANVEVPYFLRDGAAG